MFLALVLRVTGLTLGGYLRALAPAASATALMAAVVLAVRAVSPAVWPVPMQLLAQTVTGAAAYAAVVYWLHRARVEGFLAMVRTIRS